MTNDVGNGVRLTRARRTLDDDAIGNIQQLDDADLFVVEGLREVEVARLLAARGALRVVRGGYTTESWKFDDRVGRVWVGHDRSNSGRVGPGFLSLLLQLFQVLQEQAVGARTRKENPRVGDFELVVRLGQRPVLRRDFVWPVDTVGVEVGNRSVKQRLEGAAVKRRKGCGSLREEFLCRLLQIGNARVIEGCVPIDLDAGIGITRPDFHFGRHGVERHFDQPSDQRVARDHAVRVPNAEAHAPDQLDLCFDNVALELLLEREELRI